MQGLIVRVITFKYDIEMPPSREQNGKTNIQSLSDNALMGLMEKGEMDALEEIYVRYGGMVKSVIYRVVPNVIAADVDDLTQDIFISLFTSAQQFDSSKRLKPWLYAIAANKAADNKRNSWLHANLLNRHSASEQTLRISIGENVDTRMGLRKQLALAFKMLPKAQHDVMILHSIEGFKGTEIAQILGIEVNTVWVRLHRARKTLSKKMKDLTTA